MSTSYRTQCSGKPTFSAIAASFALASALVDSDMFSLPSNIVP